MGKIIAGNWKMNKTSGEAVAFVKDFLPRVESGVSIILCPSFISLHEVGEALAGSNVALGAQDVYVEESGAFTGEVSVSMLAAAGVTYVIVGHSERRQLLGEKDPLINKKVRRVVGAGLHAILCVGETLHDRNAGRMQQVVSRQVTKGLSGVVAGSMKNVLLAYEPVWAIGTGKTATPSQAAEAHRSIRTVLGKLFSSKIAANTKIVYGGSVTSGNTAELMAQKGIDGALVGGASLDAATFGEVVKNAR